MNEKHFFLFKCVRLKQPDAVCNSQNVKMLEHFIIEKFSK
jgi:hypothetical protein